MADNLIHNTRSTNKSGVSQHNFFTPKGKNTQKTKKDTTQEQDPEGIPSTSTRNNPIILPSKSQSLGNTHTGDAITKKVNEDDIVDQLLACTKMLEEDRVLKICQKISIYHMKSAHILCFEISSRIRPWKCFIPLLSNLEKHTLQSDQR